METRSLSVVALLSVAWVGCGPAAGALGASCTSDDACDSKVCLTTLTGGYCSQRCEAASCGDGSLCAALEGGSFCLQACTIGVLDCREGYACEDVSAGSICIPRCTTANDCGPGAGCREERCLPGQQGVIGNPCLLNVGCTSGLCEVSSAGGMCTQGCAQDGPGYGEGCGAGAVCKAVSEAGGLCHAQCDTAADCRSGYLCESGACVARCRGPASCATGYTCDPQSGACIEGTVLPRQLGAKCVVDGDCDASYCLDQPNQQFPSGYCSADCTDNPAVCGSAGLCLVPADPMFASACYQRCTSNFDCRGDYFCASLGGTDAICFPRCTAVPLCTAPDTCDSFSGLCVAPGMAGSSAVRRVPLGTLPLSGAQTIKEFSLDVPADAVSFTLVMKGDVGGISAVAKFFSPSNEVLFDIENFQSSKVRALPVNDGDFAFLFPNTPRVALVPGRYRFELANEGGRGTGEVFALVKTATGPLQTGRLDLNFWFAGLAPLTAATAPTDASFQEALAQFRALYATAGITLGTVSYFDVPAAEAASLSVIDTTDGRDSELRRLFALSRGAPNTALNFFMVSEIRGAMAGFVILGVAGGIPGIPFEQGTNASGVAVTALDLQRAPGQVARTMAHEAGHWLGLWHTSEQSGAMHDPLADTVECAASRDSDRNKIVSAAECAGSGSDLLMFWEAGERASTLSGNQGFVLQRNPVVSQ